MSILSQLKKSLADRGVPIEIGGVPFLVIQPSQAVYRDLIVEAESHARSVLSSQAAALRKKPIDPERAAELASSIPGREFRTEYDAEFATQYLLALSRGVFAYALRTPDGGMIWKTEQEKTETIALLSQFPEAEPRVKAALEEAEKKRQEATPS